MAKGRVMLGEELLLTPVNLKALALGTGLALIGLTGAAWAQSYPTCKQQSGATRSMQPGTATVCQTQQFPGGTSDADTNGYGRDEAVSQCKCPGYYQSHTQKCKYSQVLNNGQPFPPTVYSCQ